MVKHVAMGHDDLHLYEEPKRQRGMHKVTNVSSHGLAAQRDTSRKGEPSFPEQFVVLVQVGVDVFRFAEGLPDLGPDVVGRSICFIQADRFVAILQR